MRRVALLALLLALAGCNTRNPGELPVYTAPNRQVCLDGNVHYAWPAGSVSEVLVPKLEERAGAVRLVPCPSTAGGARQEPQ